MIKPINDAPFQPLWFQVLCCTTASLFTGDLSAGYVIYIPVYMLQSILCTYVYIIRLIWRSEFWMSSFLHHCIWCSYIFSNFQADTFAVLWNCFIMWANKHLFGKFLWQSSFPHNYLNLQVCSQIEADYTETQPLPPRWWVTVKRNRNRVICHTTVFWTLPKSLYL